MQDDDELSYAVKPLGNHLFPTHALCTGCNEVKPIKHFKCKSTNAQAKSWGYSRAIEITSEKCNICRRPRKNIKDLTLNEIRNKIATGDIKGGAYGQMLLEDKHADGIRRKKEGVLKRWQTIRDTAWAQLLTDTDKEYDRTRKQTQAKDKEQHPHLHAFITLYHDILKTTRQFFITQRKVCTRTPDKGKPWYHYVSKADKQRLTKLWDAIPYEDKQHLYAPAILNNRLTNTTEKE